MRILLISNMYPSKEIPQSGIYVKKQYEYLSKTLPSPHNINIFFIRRYRTSLLGSIWKYLKAFIKFIPHYFKHYDILHVHFFYPFFLLAYTYRLIHPDAKIVVTYHGGDVNRKLNNVIQQRLFAAIAQKINYNIAVGPDLSAAVQQKLKVRVDRILCAGVDKRIFYPMPETKKIYDFTFVGTLKEFKGIDILKKAIEQLAEANADYSYCIIGSGSYEKKLNPLFNQQSITWKKSVNQDTLRKIYNQSRFLVLPSRQDAFGLVITESMYCGTPSIVSNLGGFKQQVQDRHNGFVLPKNNERNLASIMQEVMQLPSKVYQKFSENAANSNQQFSLQFVCKELLSIYKALHKK